MPLRSALKLVVSSPLALGLSLLVASHTVLADPPAAAPVAPVRATPPAEPARPAIAPIDRAELELLRPLLSRGPVILGKDVGRGADARTTLFLRINAPLDLVRRVLVEPTEYPAYVQALRSAEVLSQHDRRAAFRFHASAAFFDVTADATILQVGARRVDIDIPSSILGAAGSRWEFFPEDATHTVVGFTVWSDPAQASWIVRQLIGNSGWANTSANMTVQTVLGLAVKRRAEILAGATLPVRPTRARVENVPLDPMPAGPWLSLAIPYTMVSYKLGDDGALESVSTAGWANLPGWAIVNRMREVGTLGSVWNWLDIPEVLSRGPDESRFRVRMTAPFGPAQGVISLRVLDRDTTLLFEGVEGDFTGEQRRLHFEPSPIGGTYAIYTSAYEVGHASPVHRLLIDRDPWVGAGMSAFWSMVALRTALASL